MTNRPTIDIAKIPAGTLFNKLKNDGEPYKCIGWQNRKFDGNETFYLCYEFPSRDGRTINSKRAAHVEIENAAEVLMRNKSFNRADFNKLCPLTKRCGSCGYAVVGGVLEILFGAEYRGTEGFVLVS